MMYRREVDIAYLAGLTDGEGSIIIRRNCGHGNVRGLSLIVQIAMADKEMMQWAKSLYGGQVHTYRDSRNEKWKAITHWHISARQALAFLVDISPYLRVKAEEAMVAIEFQSAKSARQSRHLTEDERAREVCQCALLKALKEGIAHAQ